MSDIKHLQTVPEIINEGVLETAERLIEYIKNGSVISLMIVAEGRGGEWIDMSSGVTDLFKMLGMIDVAKACIRERLFER